MCFIGLDKWLMLTVRLQRYCEFVVSATYRRLNYALMMLGDFYLSLPS